MGTGAILLTGTMALAFAAIHIFIYRLTFLDRIPRSRWLSAAGGVAVAYVFLHIKPQLAEHGAAFGRQLGVSPELAEVSVQALALAGLASFYGLERAVKLSRARNLAERRDDRIEDRLLWLHVGSFAMLNLLIGYLLLHREDATTGGLLLYFGAMALHFVSADFGMRAHHPEAYDRTGRWIIAAAAIAGWGLGLAVELSALAIGGVFAFVAGGVVLNVMKEELPAERESRFIPFATAAAAYALLVFAEAAATG